MKKISSIFFLLILSIGIKGQSQEWKKFDSLVGKCSLFFPYPPQHFQEKTFLPDEQKMMQYDVYVSEMKGNIFLFLIADYPIPLVKKDLPIALEGFLRGILHRGGELINANRQESCGYPALDFFVKKENSLFKGRVQIVGCRLYLLSVEGNENNLFEENFQKFVKSFQLIQFP